MAHEAISPSLKEQKPTEEEELDPLRSHSSPPALSDKQTKYSKLSLGSFRNSTERMFKSGLSLTGDVMKKSANVTGQAVKVSFMFTKNVMGSKKKEKASRPLAFGVSLEETLVNEFGEFVRLLPVVVEDAIKYLESKGLEEEGIFRQCGSVLEVNSYKEKYDKGEPVDLSLILDPHVVSGLLKMFLRELPEQFFPDELKQQLDDIKDNKDLVSKLPNILSLSIPIAHRRVLKYVFKLVSQVNQKSDLNKMGLDNLVIIFSPVFGISPLLCRTLIKHYEAIFESEIYLTNYIPDDLMPPRLSLDRIRVTDEASKTSRRRAVSLVPFLDKKNKRVSFPVVSARTGDVHW